MLTLNPASSVPLITQIIEGVRELVDTHVLKPGTKLPSIRAFAATHSVSMFTVVEAYDRLVAQGVLVARAHQGFFVPRLDEQGTEVASSHRLPSAAARSPEAADFDEAWFLQRIFEHRGLPIKPGCGWLPSEWLFEEAIRRGFRKVAAEGLSLSGYGDPMGHLPLRRHIAQHMALTQQLPVLPGQVLLSHGSSQALDWAVRTLVKPGQAVLIDDPCYPNLRSILQFQGARVMGVPRTPTGYDLGTLDELVSRHRPVAFFTQPRMQSPTGSRASLAQLHKLLTLAGRHDLIVVENDLYADLDVEQLPSLASLDELQRVIHIGSYSKTISPNLRVGFLMANPDMIARFAHLKMLSGLTSSEVSEKLVYHIVTDGRWRKHLKGLRDRLKAAHERTLVRLGQLGFEVFCEPDEGLFLWARHPEMPNSAPVAREAAAHGIMLAPGQLFLVDSMPTDWMRFNVAFSEDEAIWHFLARQLDASRPDTA
ncbi:MAG: PLP-dependent aminotransferase family protein [Lautropia sp.]|nr:PLP-dependent aminotransferase family protein [Lautropia sp.]